MTAVRDLQRKKILWRRLPACEPPEVEFRPAVLRRPKIVPWAAGASLAPQARTTAYPNRRPGTAPAYSHVAKFPLDSLLLVMFQTPVTECFSPPSSLANRVFVRKHRL